MDGQTLRSDFWGDSLKILLFGANGQVGWELQRSLSPLGELIALDRRSTDLCGDLTDLNGIADTVRRVAPSVVVNAAAYTAVDKAESDAEVAHRVNAEAPGVLAQAATAAGAWLVHYSPSSLVRPYTLKGPVGSVSTHGLLPLPSNT